jgi:transcriptional regulator GlxA family with amidase domain
LELLTCGVRKRPQSPACYPCRRYRARVLIDIVVYDGLDELDAWGPAEVFRSAGTLGADVSVRLVTRARQDVVTGAYGLRFLPDAMFDPEAADVIVVPGGGWAARARTGAWGEVERGHLLPLLKRARETTPLLAGVCTGTMLLAHAGVVGTRRAATHHLAWSDLEAAGATVVRERVVDDGDLVTSGGVTSGIDLALWIVEREISRDLANDVADRMEYSRSRPNRG